MKVLHFCCALDGGGVEKLLLDYYRRIDHNNIQFDFIIAAKREGILEKEFRHMGAEIYRFHNTHSYNVKYLVFLRNIIRNGHYDAIHCHGGSWDFVPLLIAKIEGVPIRIAHSHLANVPQLSLCRHLKRCLTTYVAKFCSTALFACGKDAAIWMWGKKAYNNGNVHIMTNAIDTKRFEYSEEKRNKIRAELGLEGKFVVGNVARLVYQKNHEFMIKIFAEIRKIRNDAFLMLVGRGELEEEIRNQVASSGLGDSVLFMGVRDDVPDLLNAMDVFVLPSRYEGLGIVYIEAQANGLCCFGTDEGVPHEAALTDTMTFLSEKLSPEIWAEAICSVSTSRNKSASLQVAEAGYDINSEAPKLEEYYNELYKLWNKKIKGSLPK